MTIECKQPYGGVDEARLLAFEARLAAPLPHDFRAFLVDFNGAHFSNSAEFEEVPGGSELGDIFGLHTGPAYLRLDHAYEAFRDVIRPSLVVFASDPHGNYFAMSIAGPDRRAVYFVDHEQLPELPSQLPRVAQTFTELVELRSHTRTWCKRLGRGLPRQGGEYVRLTESLERMAVLDRALEIQAHFQLVVAESCTGRLIQFCSQVDRPTCTLTWQTNQLTSTA